MTSSSTAGTSPEIHGKRAGKPVGLRCNVAALANAIRTAHERGVRKESYEDFKLARLRVRAAPLPTKVAERLNHFGAHELSETEFLVAPATSQRISRWHVVEHVHLRAFRLHRPHDRARGPLAVFEDEGSDCVPRLQGERGCRVDQLLLISDRLDGTTGEVDVETEIAALDLVCVAYELLARHAEVGSDCSVHVHVVEMASVDCTLGRRQQQLLARGGLEFGVLGGLLMAFAGCWQFVSRHMRSY